jgi:16S rRNA (adenine1518-N6/adenine1519-N6)-dimethyltransferase
MTYRTNEDAGHRAKKSLGQNFLMHQQIADRIADAAAIEGKTVLEIGPGTGMLTRALLARATKVIALEADAELIPRLSEEFAEAIAAGKLSLLHQDVRAFDPSTIDGGYALVANIPYYITGEIFRQFLTAAHKPASMTLLVQKEVAIRIARSKKESLLSLSVKAFGTPSYEFTVPRGAFKPAPNVDSAVISITDIRQDAFAGKGGEEKFFTVLRAGFAHKRKQLAKNLGAIVPDEIARAALVSAHIPERARSEDINLSSWRALTDSLSSYI